MITDIDEYYMWTQRRAWKPGDPLYRHPDDIDHGAQHYRPILQFYSIVQCREVGYMRWRNTGFSGEFGFGWQDRPIPGPWTWLQPR